MTQTNRNIRIQWKLETSTFYTTNAKELEGSVRYLGSSIRSVKSLMSNQEELKVLLRPILGIDPNSSVTNWDSACKYYLDSFSVDISSGGKDLETGWNYDINDTSKKHYIDILKESNKAIKDDKSLAEYCEDKVKENEKYKYATPINHEDYIIYRYSLEHPVVANDVNDLNKSSHISFYLHSKQDEIKIKKASYDLELKAMKKYIEVISDDDKVDNVLNAFGIFTPFDSTEDKNFALSELYKSKPNEFIKIADDKQLENKATIERYIASGILRRLSNSTIIVDANEPDIILGNTTEEAISYITNAKNKANVSEYQAKYKAMKQ